MARQKTPKEPTFPTHIAIIMDGNGRWAKQHRRPRLFGHAEGLKAIRRIVTHGDEIGVKTFTLYAFSTENWTRPRAEVEGLMHLMARTTRGEIDALHAKNVRMLVQGRLHELPKGVRGELQRAIDMTAGNTGLNLNLAINYSGRAEIVDAARRLSERAVRGEIDPAAISVDDVNAATYHPELGDPDLLIRTGGEMRISNFMLWQIAYTELWVTETYWPDFDEAMLDAAIAEFQNRERRFGGK